MRALLAMTLSVTAVALLAALPLGAQPSPITPPPIDRVLVPEGAFTMGTDTEGEGDERPAHTVTVPAFRIDRREVSRGDWRRCVRARVCSDAFARPTWTDPRGPVSSVNWSMANRYCRWAGGRLPTEVEWEKAARGTDGRRFPWGNDAPTLARAVYGQRMNLGQPMPVGTHPDGASPYGALDMAGNVWEWTASVYDPYAYRFPTRVPTCVDALASLTDLRRGGHQAFTGAMGLPHECERTIRGGAWNYWPSGLRVTNRVHHPPRGRYPVTGFRCADDVTNGG